MDLAPYDARSRTLRMRPTRALHLPPPGRVRGASRWREVVRQQSPKDEGPALALGLGAIARPLDEDRELSVCDGVDIDLEGRQRDRPGVMIRLPLLQQNFIKTA